MCQLKRASKSFKVTGRQIDRKLALMEKEKKIQNKKHSENADTSTSVTFALDVTSRPRKLMSLDIAYCIVPWYNDVITHSNFIKFKHKSTKGISKQNFILIGHKRAEI